jgi:hypothetical protein
VVKHKKGERQEGVSIERLLFSAKGQGARQSLTARWLVCKLTPLPPSSLPTSRTGWAAYHSLKDSFFS